MSERANERTSERVQRARPCPSLPIQFISLRSTHVYIHPYPSLSSPVSQTDEAKKSVPNWLTKSISHEESGCPRVSVILPLPCRRFKLEKRASNLHRYDQKMFSYHLSLVISIFLGQNKYKKERPSKIFGQISAWTFDCYQDERDEKEDLFFLPFYIGCRNTN